MNFNFSQDYILENEIVLLRPLKADDTIDLIPISINEPEIWKYSLLQANGVENLRAYIKMALVAKANKKEYPFIVFDKLINQLVGSTRFYDIQITQSTLQLGYTWYSKIPQGTGLNTNCKFFTTIFF